MGKKSSSDSLLKQNQIQNPKTISSSDYVMFLCMSLFAGVVAPISLLVIFGVDLMSDFISVMIGVLINFVILIFGYIKMAEYNRKKLYDTTKDSLLLISKKDDTNSVIIDLHSEAAMKSIYCVNSWFAGIFTFITVNYIGLIGSLRFIVTSSSASSLTLFLVYIMTAL